MHLAIESGDQDVRETTAQQFGIDMAAAQGEAFILGQETTAATLAFVSSRLDDPVAAYLAELIETQTDATATLATLQVIFEKFRSGDWEGALSDIADVIEVFAEMVDRLREVDPPAEVVALHARYTELLHGYVVVLDDMLASLRRGEATTETQTADLDALFVEAAEIAPEFGWAYADILRSVAAKP
jgi:hypothetical protein